MKKVLIALDFDPSAQKIAETGFSFAQRMKAEVTLFHVLANPQHYKLTEHVTIMGFAGRLNTNEELSEKALEPQKISQLFLDKSKHYLGDNHIQTLIGDGDCSEAILKAANKIGVEVYSNRVT